MKEDLYSTDGKKIGTFELPKEIFGLPWNSDLVHHAVTVMQGNKRAGTAHAKDRSEVRGGGIKPWRQKGTGRARHGSIRSPLWVGGGVTHGPLTEKKFGGSLNKKARRKALRTVLSEKGRVGAIVLLKDIKDLAKTKDARLLLETLEKASKKELVTRRKNATLIVLPEVGETIQRSFRNLGNVMLVEARNLNVLDLLTFRHLLIVSPEKVCEVLEDITKKTKRVMATQ